MVPLQFLGQNAHFAVGLLSALAAFAVFFLTFDAWTQRRTRVELVKWLGFIILALGFLTSAAVLDDRSFIPGLLAGQIAIVAVGLRLVAYAMLVAGQLLDPLQKRPEHVADPVTGETVPRPTLVGGLMVSPIGPAMLPLLAFTVAGLYLRRATTGLERHLRPVAWAFGWFGLYELLSLALLLQGSTNPLTYRLVAVYGPLWWVAQAGLLVGGVILGRWVWQYLTKRLLSQLFMVFTTATVAIFFVTTMGFSFLLLRNVQRESLDELSTASRVLDYAVASRQAAVGAENQAAALSPDVITAVAARNHATLAATLTDYLPQHGLSSLRITDSSGVVLLRGEDPERWGDSVSGDSIVGRALIGEATSAVEVKSGVSAQAVNLVAARPVRNAQGAIIGTVAVGRAVSNAFVDGIKSRTGLDSSVYGGAVLSATTLTGADGTTRSTGISETNAAVTARVLKAGKPYAGTVTLANRAYLASYVPLKGADGNPIGMLQVSRPQDHLLAVAGRSIQLTFLLVIVLLLVSIYPIYRVSRKISEQVR